MSAGGFISQALLGATGGAAAGIGERLREDAKLKRQQALADTKKTNAMEVNTHTSALNIGEQNLQNEHAAGEAEKGRKHDLAMAEKKFGQQKDLVDYKYGVDLKLARKQAEQSGDLTEWQTKSLDRVSKNIDHLHEMESALEGNNTGGGTIINMMGKDPAMDGKDKAEKMGVLRQRIVAEEIKYNRILGDQRGIDASAAYLSQGANLTDPAQQSEFIADLKEEGEYSDQLAADLQAVWGSKDKPSQEVDTAQAQPEPAQSSKPGENTVLAQNPPAQKPEGGMISQAAEQSAPPVRDQGPQPTADERPGSNPRPKANPNDGKPMLKKKLGPMLEQGAQGIVDAQKSYRNDRLSSLAKQLSQAANGTLENKYLDVKSVIERNPEVLRRLSVEDIQSLQEKYGKDFINQFLQ